MNRWSRSHLLLAAIAVAVAASFASARPTHAEACPPSDVSDELAYLRRLSLDLRGRAPSFEELERVATVTKRVEPEAVDGMLSENAYVETMRAFFRDLLAVNLVADFTGDQFLLVVTEPQDQNFPPSNGIYWNFNRARHFRGGNRPVPCRNVPAVLNPDGEPETQLDTELGSGAQREGYVLVHPYWAPDPNFTVKVCAFDASDKTVSLLTGERCDQPNGARDCGCGPNGRACQWIGPDVPYRSTISVLNRSFVEQALRIFDRVARDDAPYTDVLTTRRIEVDGPIAHYFTYQARAASTIKTSPEQGFTVPPLPWTSADWVTVEPQGKIAGVLTSPFYLVKYTSNRARANRFYNAFLCSHFTASPAGLPDPSDACTNEPNLTKRCGCKDCHATLEPTASYWGRWGERAIFPLPPATYPKYDPACAAANPPASCSPFRLVADDVTHPALEPYKGMLRSYVFAEPFEANIEAGPEALAKNAIESGQLAACTTRRMFTRLVGREPRDYPDERAQLEEIARTFADGYRLRTLLRSIVSLPQYKGDRR